MGISPYKGLKWLKLGYDITDGRILTRRAQSAVEGAKLGQNGLKVGSKHLFEHPKWSGITFGKTHF